MQNQHTHTSTGQPASRAIANNASSTGISLPARYGQTAATIQPKPAPVVQRVIGGLEDYARPEAIPEAWVDAFINDILDPRCHLYDNDILPILDSALPNWADIASFDNSSGDHWDVNFTNGFKVVTKADGNCGIYAMHAVLHANTITGNIDNYTAPDEYVAGKRKEIQQAVASERDDIKKRIAEQIGRYTIVAECGFGALLTATLEPLQKTAIPFTLNFSSSGEIPLESAFPNEVDMTGEDLEKTPSRPVKRTISSRDVSKWEGEKNGELVHYIDDGWNVKIKGFNYRVLNADQSTFTGGAKVRYQKPVTKFKGGVLEAFTNTCRVVSIDGKTIDASLGHEDEEALATAQQEADTNKRQKTGSSKQEKYVPQYKKGVKYAVEWNSRNLTVSGKTASRNMHTTLDMDYQQNGQTHQLPGERTHEKLHASNATTHGNIVAGYYRLAFFDGDSLQVTKGTYFYYGSGKTQGSATEKHRNADEIATMLVDSGQITSADEYDDGKHSHSEQALIVGLSQDITVFDKELLKLNSIAERRKIIVTALLIDLYSAPNTVCKKCHDSLEIFLATTDWKEKVTAHLDGLAAKTMALDKPEIILRASANVPFGGTSADISKAKKEQKGFTAEKGKADIFFVERTPFDKHY